MNNNFFYCLVFGFSSGIFLSSFFKIGFSFFLFLLILACLLSVFGKFLYKGNTRIILLASFIFFLALGVLRYEIKDVRTDNNDLLGLIGEKVLVIGVVSDEPSIKEQNTHLVISSQKVNLNNSEVSLNQEKISISTGLFPEFKYGDLIEVEGKLEKPKNFSSDTGSDFDYVGYLAKDDIFYQIGFAEVRVISHGQGSFIRDKLFTVKNNFIRKINLLIKEPESSLLSGLLLGAKNSLGYDWQENFRIAGVSHIVALSGYNITIVAESIMVALAFLPRAFSLSFGVLGIFLFTIMTGGAATVVRASIMALLVLLAKSTGRTYDVSRALLLAGVFMLIQNPKILVFDVSFQLSFLSTLALIIVAPLVEKKVTFITEKYKLRELVVATISTQVFVLPFILYKMGMISVFSLITNVLILPFIPLVMLLGFLVGSIGFISTTLAIPIAFSCSLLLAYILKVIYLFSHLPFASVSIDNFPVTLMVLVYAIFMIIIWRSQKFSKIKKYEY
jgi:competence protein ComEC